MIYDHLVKHNGKYYAAGEEVPKDDEFSSDVSDKDITFETDAIIEEKATSRRGRPKRVE